MIIKRMRWDQKQSFNKTFIDNGDGTFYINTIIVLGGVAVKLHGRSDVIDTFMKCIVNNKMQVTT